jgi:2-polyprenyl-3-methyl-5-hydroxy-6-metoxy-1,4-benzoquinol methylase
MTAVDRLIQRWRIAKAGAYIRPGDHVLDIGCSDGALFRQIRHIGSGVGVEPLLDAPRSLGAVRLVPGTFPDAIAPDERFDVITLLAVLEHIPLTDQPSLAKACAAHVRPGGRVIITVPDPAVDRILDVLQRLRIVHGMSLEEHYGFVPEDTVRLFVDAGLRLASRRRFQWGLNNLFVFQL